MEANTISLELAWKQRKEGGRGMRREEKTIHEGFATVCSEAEPVDALKTHLKTHFYSQAFNCV